ncbi:nuclear transport factor 2 family protein [Streptomyces sp. SHP 1-2]|uniref:nuclear transport factor 2 family protein n=1 Tax=Streptomyces sp. SHP 1-2 TaxID=2769489 RepID=UPI0022387F3C|nr:nuclear transport factor 2 family protein [Streptomyces sp. SHP 1-2]MCW5249742.1 nuclear transport factor 2 family protein [Streptomyces sp. SHP 1-2]
MTTATGETTRAVVEELLRRIAGGGPEHIAELYDASCDWLLAWPEDEHGRPDLPWARHHGPRTDAAAHYRELAAHHVPGAADTRIGTVLVDGEDAVVLGEIRQTAAPTGRAYRAGVALRLTVRDGLIVRHHVYEDSLSVYRAFAG